MSKSIKISAQAYSQLRDFQRPRESLGEVIARLIELYNVLDKVGPLIEGAHNYRLFQSEQRDKEHPVD